MASRNRLPIVDAIDNTLAARLDDEPICAERSRSTLQIR
jgi:hypothetical protein